MKKSLYAILVILLTSIGAEAIASKLDMNIQRVATQTTNDASNDNHGVRTCGSKVGK